MSKPILVALFVSVVAVSPSLAMEDMQKSMGHTNMHHAHCLMKKEHVKVHDHMTTRMMKVCR